MATLESVESISYNGINLVDEFTDEGSGEYLIINSVYGRSLQSVEHTSLTLPAKAGGYVAQTIVASRIITVNLSIKSESFAKLRKDIDSLNEILDAGKDVDIVFDDESDRTYRGRFAGIISEYERSKIAQISFEILCSDPYKYGNEDTTELQDSSVVENKCSEITEPIIELTAKQKVTYAMVENGIGEYNLIGYPLDEEGQEEIVDREVRVLYENGSTLGTWSTALNRVDTNFNDISGSMTSDSSGIRAQSYGTGDKMHGPAVTKELPRAIEDFKIASSFDIISNNELHNFRMEIYFLDEDLNMIGKMGIKDNSRVFKRRHGLGRVGPYRGSGPENGYAIGNHNYNRDITATNTLMHLWVTREGNLYTFYIARWANQKYNWVVKETYLDASGEFSGKLKYITLFIGSYKDRVRPSRLRINYVEVTELKKLTVDQTPYILGVGDTVTFDHELEEVLINGEDAMMLKHFGAQFWRLLPGHNTVMISPPGAFDATIKFKEKYK